MARSYDRDSYGSARPRSRGRGEEGASVRRGTPVYRDRSSRRGGSASGAADARSFSRTKASYGRTPVSGASGGSSQVNPSNPYSRSRAREQYGTRRNKGGKGRKVLIAVLVVVLLAVIGCAVAGIMYISKIQGNLNEGVDDKLIAALDNSTPPGEPFYMLLMGTDGSADRAESVEFAGDAFRTDSIMLVRVDPQQKKAAIISLMRDTMVNMGVNGTQKLNAAHFLGGPAYAVEVVSQMAGVPISHYAEIDFDGFLGIVDTIGGIEVDVPMEIDDEWAGGYVAAGPQTLSGEQALILCRSRHAFDEYGKGDEYRAANQRLVIGAIARKVLSSDVATMVSTVEALSEYVTTDMSVFDIITLANHMRGMDTEADLYSAVNPTTSQLINDIWWEVMDDYEWRNMIDRMNQGLPPTSETYVDPRTGVILSSAGDGGAGGSIDHSGSVSIKNGTAIAGAATQAEEKIAALGYTTSTGNADSDGYSETLVVFRDSDRQAAAQEMVDTLGVGRAVQDAGEFLFDADFLIVIGADWQ